MKKQNIFSKSVCPVLSRAVQMLTVLALVALSACNVDDGLDVKLSELGTPTNEYIVPAEAGEVGIKVYSNLDFQLSFLNDVDWGTLENTRLKGDTTFLVAYEANDEFPRMAAIGIYAPRDNRYDTVYIKQQGAYSPELNLTLTSTTVLGNGGKVSVPFTTNIDFEDIKIDVKYLSEDGEKWIKDDFSHVNGFLIFNTDANPSEKALRNAKITLTYVDGWSQKLECSLYITQANALNQFGVEASFPEVRALAGGKVVEDIFIEGYVVSEAGNMNVAGNPNTTTTRIDYDYNKKAVYIESIDGQYGFMLLTSTVEDNIFERYSKVSLLLKGASVNQYENPNRYVITGITSSMLMNAQKGSAASIPLKEKYIGDLTDDDIYTFVKLKDCELPVRKGSLTPLNEGYSITFNASRVDKYPILVRDIQGNSLYMYTNMLCPYRRDGQTLPYGSGSISGVIVNEPYTRFEFEDTDDEETYGNIGRYQIRHLTREDIDLAPDFENSFSALLVEYRYMNRVNGVLLPTTGNGKLTHTSPDYSSTAWASGDHTYLGPIGAANKGNKAGNGITKEDGSVMMWGANTNSDGKGAVDKLSADISSAWTNSFWWNEMLNQGEAWIIEFSTLGLTTNQLSLQVSSQNTSIPAPRYFDVEWSTHGDHYQGEWSKISSYSVPDVVSWSLTLLSQSSGFKYVNIPLPLEMLGKEKVFIRLKASRNIGSDGEGYANTTIVSGKGNSLNYVAIRYNK